MLIALQTVVMLGWDGKKMWVDSKFGYISWWFSLN